MIRLISSFIPTPALSLHHYDCYAYLSELSSFSFEQHRATSGKIYAVRPNIVLVMSKSCSKYRGCNSRKITFVIGDREEFLKAMALMQVMHWLFVFHTWLFPWWAFILKFVWRLVYFAVFDASRKKNFWKRWLLTDGFYTCAKLDLCATWEHPPANTIVLFYRPRCMTSIEHSGRLIELWKYEVWNWRLFRFCVYLTSLHCDHVIIISTLFRKVNENESTSIECHTRKSNENSDGKWCVMMCPKCTETYVYVPWDGKESTT